MARMFAVTPPVLYADLQDQVRALGIEDPDTTADIIGIYAREVEKNLPNFIWDPESDLLMFPPGWKGNIKRRFSQAVRDSQTLADIAKTFHTA